MADNKDVVRRYYDEVWGKGDPGAIDQFLADDYVDHNPPPGMAGDKASAGQIVAAITSDMSDINMDIRNVKCRRGLGGLAKGSGRQQGDKAEAREGAHHRSDLR